MLSWTPWATTHRHLRQVARGESHPPWPTSLISKSSCPKNISWTFLKSLDLPTTHRHLRVVAQGGSLPPGPEPTASFLLGVLQSCPHSQTSASGGPLLFARSPSIVSAFTDVCERWGGGPPLTDFCEWWPRGARKGPK